MRSKRSLSRAKEWWHVKQEVLSTRVKLTVIMRTSSCTRKLISTLCMSLKVSQQTPSPQRQRGCTTTILPSATTAVQPPQQCSASSKTRPSSSAPAKAQPDSKSDRQLALRRCPHFQTNCSISNKHIRRLCARPRPYRTIMMSSCTRRSFSTIR